MKHQLLVYSVILLTTLAFQPLVRVPNNNDVRLTMGSDKLISYDSPSGRMLNKIVNSPLLSESSSKESLNALKYMDTSRADNFYSSVMPHVNDLRGRAAERSDINDRVLTDSTFTTLMSSGFQQRLAASTSLSGFEMSRKSNSNRKGLGTKVLYDAAKITQEKFDLHKSDEEQLLDFKREQMLKRPSYMQVVPQFLYKYIDYLISLKITPTKSDQTKNLLLGSFFAFVIWANNGLRSSFMYLVVGNLATLSSLLTRNMPRSESNTPTMDRRRKVATWSSSAFKTAACITLGISGLSSFVMAIFTALLPLSSISKSKIIMISSILSVSYFSSFYEVYEDKDKNGYRWKQALEGSVTPTIDSNLKDKINNNEKSFRDEYQYQYNPEEAEYPLQPKYIDEIIDDGKSASFNNDDIVDEEEAIDHFAKWKEYRKESRRPPVEVAPPETAWVGSKKGMYVEKFPSWLSKSYKKNVLNANAWRGKPTKFIKDYQEFESVEGPLGFRDKSPSWLNLFGTGVWEEKITASRRAARSFGSYRKTMWKIDDKVVLQPCDGADKEKDRSTKEV